ncbi:unnamed protein product [Cyprideis torosa]|uniref:Membrane protein BRI3 n=1 Tax=Cyprideis torosa TaxID=163714 RepID=A0A7R8ZHY3_9CRUS|nr:unnamed protein product [Cyprideis torosa]CAG0883531.1 unnamed protein product [Cyprideis torosa]
MHPPRLPTAAEFRPSSLVLKQQQSKRFGFAVWQSCPSLPVSACCTKQDPLLPVAVSSVARMAWLGWALLAVHEVQVLGKGFVPDFLRSAVASPCFVREDLCFLVVWWVGQDPENLPRGVSRGVSFLRVFVPTKITTTTMVTNDIKVISHVNSAPLGFEIVHQEHVQGSYPNEPSCAPPYPTSAVPPFPTSPSSAPSFPPTPHPTPYPTTPALYPQLPTPEVNPVPSAPPPSPKPSRPPPPKPSSAAKQAKSGETSESKKQALLLPQEDDKKKKKSEVVQLHGTDEKIVVAVPNCPHCKAGTMQKTPTTCGWLFAVLCFPVGILCCLCLRERKCTKCGKKANT